MPEALLVQDGKISAFGSVSELEALASAEMVDLQGDTLMPGFIDSHSHIVQFALSLRYVSLSGTQDFNELCSRLTAYAIDQNIQTGDWIIGFGYDNNILPKKNTLRKEF